MTIGFNFTFSTDDYSYLARAYTQNGLQFSSFGGYVSRIPVWAFFTWVGFATHFYEHYHLAMYTYFIIYILGFLLLLKYTFNLHQLEIDHNHKTIGIITIIAFILYPTHHEVLYWETDFSYTIGLLFLGLSLNQRNKYLKALFIIFSFLTSEMYVFPLFSILFIESIKNKTYLKNIMLFFLSVIIYFTIRKSLIPIFGDYSVGDKLTFQILKIIQQIKSSFLQIFGMHFYKTSYILSIPYFCLLIYIFYNFFKDCKNNPLYYLSILLAIPGSFCFYWLMSYGASRALFGAQVFVNSLIVAMTYSVLSKFQLKFSKYIPLFFLIIFLAHSFKIFNLKDSNYQKIQIAKEQIKNELSKCNYNCIDQIPYRNIGIERDWVMMEDYWANFVKWISLTSRF
jgi:hypothetical protein